MRGNAPDRCDVPDWDCMEHFKKGLPYRAMQNTDVMNSDGDKRYA